MSFQPPDHISQPKHPIPKHYNTPTNIRLVTISLQTHTRMFLQYVTFYNHQNERVSEMNIKHHQILTQAKYEDYGYVKHIMETLNVDSYHIDVETLRVTVEGDLDLLDVKELPIYIDYINGDVLMARSLAESIGKNMPKHITGDLIIL